MHESKKARHSSPSGSDANTTTPENARQLVFSARARLSHTTEDYLAACQLLASTCVPQPRSSNQHSRELVLSTIDIELLTLKQEEERIQNAHKTLIDARNRAKMTAPIYSLPPETLARIFLEAACHHAHDELERPTRFPSSPVTLSAVCRLWRNIASNARSLWAHLDILIGGTSRRPRYPSSQLWVHHLQGTPLRVHIRQYDFTLPQRPGNPDQPINLDLSDSSDSDSSESWDDSGDSSDSDDSDDPGTSAATQYPVPPTSHISLSSLTSFLIPLMAHVDSLELISSLRCQFLLYSMLDRLVGDHEKSIPMRAVRIIHDEERDPLRFKMSRPFIRHYSQDHKAFFSSLVALDLRNVYPLKEHLTLTNLVELRLETPSLKKMWLDLAQSYYVIFGS
ncbi:hypothetical protein FRC06_000874 [Ceratobasidium sp. 370]|nr:hypothetical protein FRC06_000874 [Ceratobasidium sp. 370]